MEQMKLGFMRELRISSDVKKTICLILLILLTLICVIRNVKIQYEKEFRESDYYACGFGTILPQKCSLVSDELKHVLNETINNPLMQISNIDTNKMIKPGAKYIYIKDDKEDIIAIVYKNIAKCNDKYYSIDESIYDSLSNEIAQSIE